jgi:hypothetical protein
MMSNKPFIAASYLFANTPAGKMYAVSIRPFPGQCIDSWLFGRNFTEMGEKAYTFFGAEGTATGLFL